MRRAVCSARDAPNHTTTTVLAPAGWWRGLGGLTRSGSSLQALALDLLQLREHDLQLRDRQLRHEPRGGRRKPFLAAFTALCLGGWIVIGLVDIRLGLIAFAIANFAYQAALIYYDALLPDVARPIARGRLSGIGVALG